MKTQLIEEIWAFLGPYDKHYTSEVEEFADNIIKLFIAEGFPREYVS